MACLFSSTILPVFFHNTTHEIFCYKHIPNWPHRLSIYHINMFFCILIIVTLFHDTMINKDDPFTINMAIACPITSALSKHITSPSLLSTGALGTLTLTLYPVCTANATISAIDSCSHPLKADVPYSIFVPSSRQHQQQKQQSEFFSKKKTTISRHAVITIQTFKNHFTGPMLYMFTRHYQRLGYAVIVFDRFANHQDLFTKDFSDPNTSGVYYYGFTMFEKMFPDIYNDSYSRRQVLLFYDTHIQYFIILLLFT